MNALYKAIPIEDVKFTPEEIKRMKIAYFNELSQLDGAMKYLGIELVDDDEMELYDYGYLLSQIGPLNEPTWVLYHKNNSLEKVLDIRDCMNFYNLVLEDNDTGKEDPVFQKVHLPPSRMEEALNYLINLDLKSKEGGCPVSSEYLQ